MRSPPKPDKPKACEGGNAISVNDESGSYSLWREEQKRQENCLELEDIDNLRSCGERAVRR